MKRILLLVAVMVLTWFPFRGAQSEPLRLMRFPDIAYGKIVFSYQGDLWVVPQEGGRAMRLTVHDGVESYPKFSPDGKWIAFTGNYFGGTNVFIIPAEGGEPRQLTFEPTPATVVGWTPDSQYCPLFLKPGRLFPVFHRAFQGIDRWPVPGKNSG